MFGRLDLKSRIRSGEVIVGSWLTMASPEAAEIASASGLDFLIVDMEHGSFGIDRLPDILRAVEVGGATAIVRIPDDGRSTILKVLDAGASGILVPNLSSRVQAEQVVTATKYAPNGIRGACPRIRATKHGYTSSNWIDAYRSADENILVWGLIETKEGVQNFSEILECPGIDGLSFGPFDLAQAIGLEGNYDSPEVRRIFDELRAQARNTDKHVVEATFGFDEQSVRQEIKRLSKAGVKIFICGTDRRILTSSYLSIRGWFSELSE